MNGGRAIRMTPVRVKTVKTQSQIVHFSFKKIQARSEVKTGLLKRDEINEISCEAYSSIDAVYQQDHWESCEYHWRGCNNLHCLDIWLSTYGMLFNDINSRFGLFTDRIWHILH